MSQSEYTEPVYYSSLYRHGVDDKRRVQVPAKWRPKEAEIQYTLILWPRGSQQNACLLVLPPEEWALLVGKLKAMPFSDPKAEALRRLVGTKSDRVCLPESMARLVGIEKDAVLVGLVDRFEIWNPEKYEAAMAVDEALLPDAFQMI
jgi:MraZ protein